MLGITLLARSKRLSINPKTSTHFGHARILQQELMVIKSVFKYSSKFSPLNLMQFQKNRICRFNKKETHLLKSFIRCRVVISKPCIWHKEYLFMLHNSLSITQANHAAAKKGKIHHFKNPEYSRPRHKFHVKLKGNGTRFLVREIKQASLSILTDKSNRIALFGKIYLRAVIFKIFSENTRNPPSRFLLKSAQKIPIQSSSHISS